jgi:hypothetical protein
VRDRPLFCHSPEPFSGSRRSLLLDKMSQEVTVSGTLVRKGRVTMIYVDSVKSIHSKRFEVARFEKADRMTVGADPDPRSKRSLYSDR